MWNWKVVTNIRASVNWFDLYPTTVGISDIIIPDGFLEGYRVTVDGFLVMQVVLEPLGIVLACAAIVFLAGPEGNTKPPMGAQGEAAKAQAST